MGAHRSLRRFCFIVAIFLTSVVGGCSSSGPNRNATDQRVSESLAADCKAAYENTDRAIRKVATDFKLMDGDRDKALADIQSSVKKSTRQSPQCWDTAHEHHQDYDLFYTEFDDAGEPVDRVRGAVYEQSELHLIEKYILDQLQSDSQTGLNIVVFTHGWHGNARADNTYSLEFKAVLQDIADRETKYAATIDGGRPNGSIGKHQVVGIEIAWRGDSILFPSQASVWDRKLAAETVSIGAVQELFAFLNQRYLDYSCHGSQPTTVPCDRVHLLTIGHSFGALITFRSLVSRLQSGLNVDGCYRSYGFGDMTILLNPAFEAARYRSLFNEAINRHVLLSEYAGDPALGQKCQSTGAVTEQSEVQIPTIVTLQSLGDSATGTFFPIFRRLTTLFDTTITQQESHDMIKALGWDPDFRTHVLSLQARGSKADVCAATKNPSVELPSISQTTGVAGVTPNSANKLPSETLTYCPFHRESSVQADSSPEAAATHEQFLKLDYSPGTTQSLPNYMPLWSIGVDEQIMANHDDFWNAQTVRLISILFEDAYAQTERLHGSGLK